MYSELRPFMEKNQYYYHTSVGALLVTVQNSVITEASFTTSDNILPTLDRVLPISFIKGTEFQKSVWNALLEIPKGTTVTYHAIAQKIGRPTAWRAVANAIGDNPIAYFVPCHRVVRKNGMLGGYRWGITIKKELLYAEGVDR